MDHKKQPGRPAAKRLPLYLALAVCLVLLASLAIGNLGRRYGTPKFIDVSALSPAALEEQAVNYSVQCFDTDVPNGRLGIPATVTLPREPRGAALVVMAPGFTGDRQGCGHFHPLSLQLAVNGIACIQLDFPGCGDSAEPSTAYTLSNMQRDVTAAIEYMAAEYGVDRRRVGLVGHSIGGRLASLYLVPGEGRCPIAAAALWSPANGDGLEGLEFLDIEDPQYVAGLAARAAAEGTVTSWGFELSDTFFEEMSRSHPNAGLKACGIPLLLCYTAHEGILSDKTIRETAEAVAEAGGRYETAPFAEASHNYFSADPAQADALNPGLSRALRALTLEHLFAALR